MADFGEIVVDFEKTVAGLGNCGKFGKGSATSKKFEASVDIGEIVVDLERLWPISSAVVNFGKIACGSKKLWPVSAKLCSISKNCGRLREIVVGLAKL